MKDGFSTQIHIRQNDIGQFGKSGQDAVQKIVIFPTCILQIVRRKSKKVEPKSGKPCGKCGTCIDRARAFELNGINDPAME